MRIAECRSGIYTFNGRQSAVHILQSAIPRTYAMHPLKNAVHHIWTRVRYWTYRFFSYLSGKVPVRFAYWVGNLVGDFVYLTWKEHSANAVSNMRRVLGDNADWR